MGTMIANKNYFIKARRRFAAQGPDRILGYDRDFV